MQKRHTGNINGHHYGSKPGAIKWPVATLRESVIEPLAALLEQSRDGLDADTVKQVQAIVG